MKNHYKIIGVSQESSKEAIKKETKKKIKLISESKISINEKKKSIDQLSDSFYFLNNYYFRSKLDEYIEMRSKMKSLSDDFFRVKDTLFNIKETSKIKTSDNNIYCSYSSYSSSKVDNNGDVTVVNKYISNNNGRIDGKHTITTKDKLGNDIIKEIPVNKKTFKLDYKI